MNNKTSIINKGERRWLNKIKHFGSVYEYEVPQLERRHVRSLYEKGCLKRSYGSWSGEASYTVA